MANGNERKKATEKPTEKKVKVKEISVVIEAPTEPGPTTSPTIPDPPATGHVHLCAQNGTIGWEPI